MGDLQINLYLKMSMPGPLTQMSFHISLGDVYDNNAGADDESVRLLFSSH